MLRVQFVRNVWQDMLKNGGVEKVLLPSLQIESAKQNFVRMRLLVASCHTNRLGITHGGVVSTLIDVGGSLAMSSRGMFMTGVTTDLATTYISAAGKLGETLTIDCYLQKLGRTLAFTFVEIKKDGKLVARGNHTKYVTNALKEGIEELKD